MKNSGDGRSSLVLWSYRHFWARKDVYKLSPAMQNRIDELKEAHRWGPKEMSFVLSALDADIPGPINLHEVGELALQTINYIPSISYSILSAFEPALISQASPKLLEHYSQLVRHKSILGPRPSSAICRRSSGTAHWQTSRNWRQQRRTYIYPAVRRIRDPLPDDDR